ncbi:Detected protein of unknown function [Hibiscus syriacus]|uniref:DUF4408 domain-containing protein n=1 Tax=Hibiscus syriacus TaxID=106335 RepID=A0A6A2Z6D3_HIBSY|nr:Detected protein of unknown function [Hibiscus syriacus]
MSDFIASWLTPTSLFLLLNVVIGTVFLLSRLSPPKTQPRHDVGYYSYSAPPPLLRASSSLLDRVKSINFSTFKFDEGHHHLQQHVDNDSEPHPVGRAPSILERVKSINLNLYKYPPQNPDPVYVEQPLSRPPSLLERVKSIDFTSFYRSDSGKVNPESGHLTPEEEPGWVIDTSNTPVQGQVVKRSKSEQNKVKQRKVSEKMKKSASENSRAKAGEEEEELERRRPATMRIEKTTSFGDGDGDGDGDDQGVDAKADDFINKFKQQLKLQRLDSLLRYKDMLRAKASNLI